MKLRSKKAKLRVSPNPIICLHQGTDDLSCFMADSNYAHVECWRAHFGVGVARVEWTFHA